MRKRELDALKARVERLEEATQDTSQRLAGEYSPFIVEVGHPTIEVVRYGDGPGLLPQLVISDHSSWRVGRNPGDPFFELKLVPELGSLVLPVPRPEGRMKAETFICSGAAELVYVYSAREINTIIRLLKTIKTFKHDGSENDVRFYDIAIHSETPRERLVKPFLD